MVAASCHRQGTLSPVVSGIVALVNSHKEVIRAQGIQRGQAAEAWRLADSPFLLDFLCEICEDKALGFKVQSFHVLRAMEREAARSIQRTWRLRHQARAGHEKEEPLHIENIEDLQSETEPRVQILILGAPEDVTTAVHLDLEELHAAHRSNEPPEQPKVKGPEMEVPTLASPQESKGRKFDRKEVQVRNPTVDLDVGSMADAATTKPVEAASSPSNQDETEEGIKPQKVELQDLWLQLQEGQRLWRQSTGHEARPAPKAFLSPSRHRAVKAPAPLNAPVPQVDDEPSVVPPPMSPVAPPGLEFKSKNEYRRKWNPRIAAQQRKEREKLPNVQRLPAIETPKAPELMEREVKHCSHDDPMAFECGSTATAGLSLSTPLDRGPELYGEGPGRAFEAPSRFSPEDSDDDVQMLRQKILEMNKMTADDPSEHGAQSAGISLGAPEPPRRMAELRAAAERRLRSNKESVQESLMELPKQREQRSEIPRQIRGSGAWGRSRTPGSPRANSPRGSATRTPTPRGAAYKPKHLYSSRAE